MKKKLLIAVIAMTVGFSACEKDQMLIDSSINPDEIAFSEEAIPGSWVIVYNDIPDFKKMPMGIIERTDYVVAISKEVFESASVEFTQATHVYGSSIKGLAIKLSDEEASRLKSNANVRGVYPDKMFTLRKPIPVPDPTPAGQVVPYGVIRTGYGTYTGNFKAWIIDTGIDLTHPDLNVNASLGYLAPGIRSSVGFSDDNGHGSHCAGIVAAINNEIGVVGVAAGATVVPVKVLDKRGSGAYSAIIAGIDYVAATANAGDAANLSLGGGIYEPIDLAVIALGAKGVFVAMAAGNESDDSENHSPARAEGVNLYTVSAMDVNNYFASFSNYGTHVDYCAPGVNIYSTYKSGGYTTMSGTSMSSPHVCGLLLYTGGNLNTDGYVNGDPDGNPDPIAHN
ncbi:MAG: S8 family serine peptidase [Tenuifilaceae bacterium]|nr:S8 family serine peptidase [Tenuifilaceae bacterium]